MFADTQSRAVWKPHLYRFLLMQPERQQRILAIGLNVIVLLLLLLSAYVWLLPQSVTPIPQAGSHEALWWGLWPIKVASGICFTGAVLLLLGSLFYGWRSIESKVQTKERENNLLLALFAALLLIAFFLFPLAHTRWGDAYILSKAISWPDQALRLTHSWQAPLDVFVHGKIWLWLHNRYAWIQAVDVYRLLSPMAGLGYLLILLALSRQRVLAPPWLSFGLLSSLGLIQLFFGYIENYSFAAAGVLGYLWLGMGLLQGKRPLWLAATVLALTNATHPSTVVLAPSLLYCGWRWSVGEEPQANSASKKRLGSALLQIAVPMLLVAGGTILLMELGDHGLHALMTDDRPGGGDGRWLVPLFAVTTRWEQYTMFSWPHLRDFLNEQLLVAPILLPSLLWIALWGVLQRIGMRQNPRRMETTTDANFQSATEASVKQGVRNFLLIASGFYLLFTWLWNPDYGGQRDWDLFSLAALPTALLLSVNLSRLLRDRHVLFAGAMPLIVFQALHTVAWIYQNTLPWQWPE